MDTTMVRIVFFLVGVVLVGIIVLRRRKRVE